MKRSKKYKKAKELIDKNKEYPLEEALDLLPQITTCKFDASIEIHINLNLSDKQKKTSIKGSTTFPHQVGDIAKVAVITTPENNEEAKEADIVGYEDLIKKIEKGWNDFDILIASPEVMSKVAILGKKLGPQGKMPNPKNGTVTKNLKKTIKNYKKGKINFKKDDQNGIHQLVGKASMKKTDLKKNIVTFLKAVFKEVKNLNMIPFKSIYLSPSMGPSIKLDVNGIIKILS